MSEHVEQMTLNSVLRSYVVVVFDDGIRVQTCDPANGVLVHVGGITCWSFEGQRVMPDGNLDAVEGTWIVPSGRISRIEDLA